MTVAVRNFVQLYKSLHVVANQGGKCIQNATWLAKQQGKWKQFSVKLHPSHLLDDHSGLTYDISLLLDDALYWHLQGVQVQ